MRDKDGCAAPHNLTEPAEDLVLSLCIEGTGWLIEDQHRCVPVQGSGQRYLLPFTPAEFAAVIKQISDNSIVTFWQIVYQFMNACL